MRRFCSRGGEKRRRLGSTRLHPPHLVLRISESNWLQQGENAHNTEFLFIDHLIHIQSHSNIHDTICINVDEIHHWKAHSPNILKENYEILPYMLDNTPDNELKMVKPPMNGDAGKIRALGNPSGSRPIKRTSKTDREAFRQRHDSYIRKTLPALSRRHPVRHKTRRANPQVFAVHETYRPSSGTRATYSNRAASGLTAGVIESGVIYETHSQLKPRSRIGAFWFCSLIPTAIPFNGDQ